ncbi:hypothetical protein LUZ60_015619 [Juncus effusus]|nr:hypothetical protein LUZ60_015619 [Juncus effusus]
MVGIKERITLPVPVEDSMETLIELLVSPLLPFKSTAHINPSVSQQESLAKQMQAVVLLYNFYHRKQFPQIELLSFESLCKSSVIANPAIISYFQFMQEKQTVEKISTISHDDLSIVEKAMINACDISVSLYNSFSDSNNDEMSVFESWPLERIGVFLVDKKREKCLIEIDTLVKGVWSLVEREIESEKGNNNDNNVNSGVLNELFDEIYQNLAVSEVQSRTGIESSNLRILYRHLTYSLNKEKSSTRVYIMEYTKQPGQTALAEIPIDFITERLKGPVIKTESRPEATSVASSQKVPMESEKMQNNAKNRKSNGPQKEPMELEKPQKNLKSETLKKSQKVPMEIEKTRNNVRNDISNRSSKEKGINGNLKIDNKRKHVSPSNKVEKEISTSKNESTDRTPLSSSVSKEVVKSCSNEMMPSDETPIIKTVVFDKKGLESCIQVAVKKRDELCKKHRLLEDEIAQCEMDIQTMMCGEMTPKVESILAKWENPNSNEGSQIQIKKKLKLKSSCQQELDDVCRENKLILPRYSVLPSVPDGMYTASAILRGPGFECTVSSDLKTTPKEAREQAALRLLDKLHSIVED